MELSLPDCKLELSSLLAKLTSSNLTSSNYKFDSSSVIVDIIQWNNYVPFLCSSLGLTAKDDIDKIKNIKFVEDDQLGSFYFHIESKNNDICSISMIELHYMKHTTKLSVYFTRAKNEHKFNNKIEILDESSF